MWARHSGTRGAYITVSFSVDESLAYDYLTET